MRPLRVLLVTPRYLVEAGGTEIHTHEVARRLVAGGHCVTILTADRSGRLAKDEEVEGIRVLRVRAWPARCDYFFAPGVYRTIAGGDWDVVHCQGYHTLLAPLAMLAAWRRALPYIVTFHSGGHSSRVRKTFRRAQWALLRPLLARAERLVGVSQFEADFFRQRLRLPSEQFVVIPNGSELPAPSAIAATGRAADKGTMIVSVGRLERYKGHHRVIRALPQLLERWPGLRLRIVGSGPYEATLRRLAHDLGMADRVEIRGIPAGDRQGMATVLLQAALVILLSDYESQGMAVMEALALRRPVLVADTAHLRELAERGYVQATPLDGSDRDVVEAIFSQLSRPLIPPAIELPGWDTCADSLLALYRTAAACPRHPRHASG